MSSCYNCNHLLSSIRCLICSKYYCLTCSGIHRHKHLLDAIEERLNLKINSLQIEFDENFYCQYQKAIENLKIWINNIRKEFEKTIEYELEKLIKNEFELLKLRTDEYVEEYIKYFINLRSNIRYIKEKQNLYNNDNEIVRLINIEKDLIKRYNEYFLNFQLDINSIDFQKYINIKKEFHESPIPFSLEFNYELNNPIQILNFKSSIQHISSSCLDLFVFIFESSSSSIYPCLHEYSTSLISSKISLENSIDFPHDIQIIDMYWSNEFNCLFLLTSISLHKYDKYNKKIQSNIIQLYDQTFKWHRLTTNRYGIYILNEKNLIEFYNKNFNQNGIFYMKDFIENIHLIYDLQGHSNCLCTLTYTKNNYWQIDLFLNKSLDLKRTLQLSETIRPPLKLINANQRNKWIIIDSQNHRLILFDDQMKNIQHFNLTLTPNSVTILDDKTLVISSPGLSGSRISFYPHNNILQNNIKE